MGKDRFPASSTFIFRFSEFFRSFVHSLMQCETEFASEIRRKLKPFQLLLVVQALRPDRLQSAMQQLACQLLGSTVLKGLESLHI